MVSKTVKWFLVIFATIILNNYYLTATDLCTFICPAQVMKSVKKLHDLHPFKTNAHDNSLRTISKKLHFKALFHRQVNVEEVVRRL